MLKSGSLTDRRQEDATAKEPTAFLIREMIVGRTAASVAVLVISHIHPAVMGVHSRSDLKHLSKTRKRAGKGNRSGSGRRNQQKQHI